MMNQKLDKLEEQLSSLSGLPNAISTLANQVKNLEFQIGQIASSSYEEPSIEEEEDQSEEENEDDDLINEKEEEESPLIYLSNTEQQNQEEANDELKSDMSISKPLNSSICTFFDNNGSLDFILPLESFDYKKEVRAILGILKRGGRKFTKMMGRFVRRKWCIKGLCDRSMLNKKLIDEEAQRLKYKGKEDRYPWPFR
ncbi:hypothetical protein ACS0TY_029061 [Phlomoides rotata]